MTIETFCRLCKDPVDIQVADDADEFALAMARALGKRGVACEKCRPPKKPKSARPIRPVSADP